uniref:TF-B3 domain-containing protein n=1 Tax=Steinernema glaseri TaxID=37863 RepID=A0A1I7YUN4_9BILA
MMNMNVDLYMPLFTLKCGPLFAAFLHDNCYVVLDEKCDETVLTNVDTGERRTQKLFHKADVVVKGPSWRQTFVYEGNAFVVDMGVESWRFYM